MEPDYPAAHSMDTTWYAVDGQGRVGMFFSGANGAVPVDAADDFHPAVLLEQLRSGREQLPEEEVERLLDAVDWDLLQDDLAGAGVYVFGHLEDWLDVHKPYALLIEP